MKHTLITLMSLLALGGGLHADPISKQSQLSAPSEPLFGPGWDFSVDGLFVTPEGDQGSTRAWGGGFNFEYYMNPYLGFAAGAAWVRPDSTTWGAYTGDFELRAPFEEMHLAPYAILGSGVVHANRDRERVTTRALLRTGIGLEWRPVAKFGVFTDYVFNWPGNNDVPNYGMFRLGVKVGF